MNFERKFQVFWEFFMHKNGYNVVVEGLKNTIIIAVMGLVIGIVLGTLIATARVVPKTIGRSTRLNSSHYQQYRMPSSA